MAKVETVAVNLWGHRVGAVAWDDDQQIATFEYDLEFVKTGIEISPIKMPLVEGELYTFPELTRTKTFMGMPGMLADALPEKFGNAVMAKWLEQQGRVFEDLSPVERLCYLGRRGMGALEFEPDLDPEAEKLFEVDVPELVQVARDVLAGHNDTLDKLSANEAERVEQLISIGTSAGGAKAKAVIAINPQTNEVMSGQVDTPEGFEHWLLKFSEVDNDEHESSEHIGRMEYAYHLMAVEAGIDMMSCDLLKDGENAHFMTKRFDRIDNAKFHVQSFCALSHIDRNPVGNTSYEQVFAIARELDLIKGQESLDQLYRGLVFYIIARYQDVDGKNLAFMMGGDGLWDLTPAYDLCFSYDKKSKWVSKQQMRCNGKRDNFTLDDLLEVARSADVRRPKEIIKEVSAQIALWMSFADEAGMPEELSDNIQNHFRKGLSLK